MRTIINAINGIKNDIKGKALVIVSRMVTRGLHAVAHTRCLFTQLLGYPMARCVAVRVCVSHVAVGSLASADRLQGRMAWRPGWEGISVSSRSR
jgi:hypothetical protein